jgi:hypothetical protein
MGMLGNTGKIGFKTLWDYCQEDQKGPLVMRGGRAFEIVESVVGYTGDPINS